MLALARLYTYTRIIVKRPRAIGRQISNGEKNRSSDCKSFSRKWIRVHKYIYTQIYINIHKRVYSRRARDEGNRICKTTLHCTWNDYGRTERVRARFARGNKEKKANATIYTYIKYINFSLRLEIRLVIDKGCLSEQDAA